jgi:hypothetical protein
MLGFGNQTRLAETNEEGPISGGSFRATTAAAGWSNCCIFLDESCPQCSTTGRPLHREKIGASSCRFQSRKRRQLFISAHVSARPLRYQSDRELVYRPLQFQKRSQLLIRTYNEAFSVAAMRFARSQAPGAQGVTVSSRSRILRLRSTNRSIPLYTQSLLMFCAR